MKMSDIFGDKSEQFEQVSPDDHNALIRAIEPIGYRVTNFPAKFKDGKVSKYSKDGKAIRRVLHVCFEVDERIGSGDLAGKRKTIWMRDVTVPFKLDVSGKSKLVEILLAAKVDLPKRSSDLDTDLIVGKQVNVKVEEKGDYTNVTQVFPKSKNDPVMAKEDEYETPQWVIEQKAAVIPPSELDKYITEEEESK